MKIERVIGWALLGISVNLAAAIGVFADGGNTTLIHACVAGTGTIRIVGASTACRGTETPLHWPTTARIVTDENRITNTENKNSTQDSAIAAIQTKNTQQDADIAALQGQVGGGGSGIVVKDSLGQVVGKLVDLATAFVKIGNVPIFLGVHPLGFYGGAPIPFYHTTADCSGTRYLASLRGSGALAEFPNTLADDPQTLYYASVPTQDLLVPSLEFVYSGQELAGGGQCQLLGAEFVTVATPATVNLSTLGIPPFHIE